MITIGFRRGKRRLSYNESVDEPATLIAEEPVEAEAEIPAEENEPIEGIDEHEGLEAPMLDEP
jgi:hypothetical protein